jgi:putative salt-induced outer membrane protein YdiY
MRSSGAGWIGFRVALVLSLGAAVRPGVARAAKTDLVILQNGDHITGEIKGLTRGKLDYSTDDAGRLSIEWDKVARVTSPHSFHIELGSGVRYIGRLATPSRDGVVAVEGIRSDTLAVASVVEISTLDAGFAQRVKSYLDLGFTLAKANLATTFSVGGEAAYQGPALGAALKFDSYAQGQESVPTTTRNSVRQSFSWYLPRRWSAVGLAQLEQNDELDLDHRITAGGGMQRVLGRTNNMELTVGAGLVGTQEQFSSTQGKSSDTNAEGLIALSWNAFRFDSPKLDFSLALATFPSLSQKDRVRGQTEIRLVYELFKDFNTGIRVTDTFDSSPPEGAPKNDYITTLTIGWSYRR